MDRTYMLKCSRFVAPLRIPALKQPANYEQMLRVLQTFAPGYKRDNFQSSDTESIHFSLMFISIAMVFLYLMFSISNELTRRIVKLIRFQKWLTIYTVIPIYCCLMLLSLSLFFGYETGDAIDAIKLAEKWKDTALQRNLYMLEGAYESLGCLSKKVIINNPEELDEKEEQIFGIKYAEIKRVLQDQNVTSDFSVPKYTVSKEMYLNGKLDKYFKLGKTAEAMFEPFEKKINGTFYNLKLPSVRTLYYTRTIIFVITAVTIFYTCFICFMVFLDTNTSYPNIIKIIQFIHPVLFFCIIIEYYLIWNVFSSVVDSYSGYSELIDTRVNSKTDVINETTELTFEDLLSSSVSITRFTGREKMKNKYVLNDELFELIDPSTFDIYNDEIKYVFMEKDIRDLKRVYPNFTKKFENCKQLKNCMNKKLFFETARVTFAIDNHQLRWPFETQGISWYRYLIFFNKYTFVPIASPFWKISEFFVLLLVEVNVSAAMPSFMFFILIFILLAIPLIKKNSEETTSEEYI